MVPLMSSYHKKIIYIEPYIYNSREKQLSITDEFGPQLNKLSENHLLL